MNELLLNKINNKFGLNEILCLFTAVFSCLFIILLRVGFDIYLDMFRTQIFIL